MRLRCLVCKSITHKIYKNFGNNKCKNNCYFCSSNNKFERAFFVSWYGVTQLSMGWSALRFIQDSQLLAGWKGVDTPKIVFVWMMNESNIIRSVTTQRSFSENSRFWSTKSSILTTLTTGTTKQVSSRKIKNSNRGLTNFLMMAKAKMVAKERWGILFTATEKLRSCQNLIGEIIFTLF